LEARDELGLLLLACRPAVEYDLDWGPSAKGACLMLARHTCGLAAIPVLAGVLAGRAVPAARGRQDWPWGGARHVYKQGEPIVCWRIASDDARFRKALGAVFDRQVKRLLKSNAGSGEEATR
jgi:hypothetical protein